MLNGKLGSDIFDSAISSVELLNSKLTGDTNVVGNLFYKGSESEASSTDVMALVNGKSPLNNPIFTGVVKQLFEGRGAVPLLVEPSDWTDTLENYIISKSPPTNLTDYAKTSDSDIIYTPP